MQEHKHPDDCVIEVTYDSKADSKKKMFQLRRLDSAGAMGQITFDVDGNDIKITLPKGVAERRFSICFVLPEADSSGGFAGIKIWPELEPTPAEYYCYDGPIPNTPFDLKIYCTKGGSKITMLSLGDMFRTSGHFSYCIGMNRDRNYSGIDWDDPRIYNTGDIGAGEG